MPIRPDHLFEDVQNSLTNDSELTALCKEAARKFSFLVTPSWLKKMRAGSEPDALLRQVLPVADELDHVPGFTQDPLDESGEGESGLIEKYPGRLLVMVTRSCSAHCRFCFRRHALDTPVRQGGLQAAFRQRMMADDDISEVLLSGGDPFVLSERKLRAWFDLIAEFPQVQRIRIHTREPVFSPERITPGLAAVLRDSTLPVIVAVHVNHADELDQETENALHRLRESGALLLTQTVLLRGVNDSVETLCLLFERAVECGMTPYYLHQLDRVAGAAHFAVEHERGFEIVQALRDRLPGYMVPRFVEEIPGKHSKQPIGPGN
jgi:EF-P beta-lysylation protein EpmB